MSLLMYIVVFSLIGGLLSLSLAMLLLVNKSVARSFARYAMPFAAGALLAAVFLDLFTEGLEHGSASVIMTSALIGILLFFMAERFIRWFHHHQYQPEQEGKNDPAVPLLITGDIVHNLLDGIAIAAAFMISIPAGIVTTLAVAAHEIPQEIGEFGILLSKGVSRTKVILANIMSALVATGAAVATYFIGQTETLPIGIIFGLSAGFLLYVALSDIIPSLHESHNKKHLFDWQPILLLSGVLVVGFAGWFVHSFIG